jgi:hypothetical protein
MNRLTGQEHHRRVRETALYPTLKANLDAALNARDEAGGPKADLVELLAPTKGQLAAPSG